jgi:hypothetical protein
MIWVSHPTGNTFVRALLRALARSEHPFQFYTTLGFSEEAGWFKALPEAMRARLARRSYQLPAATCQAYPTRELARLLLTRLCSPATVERLFPRYAPREIYRQLDAIVARDLQDSVTRIGRSTPTRMERCKFPRGR